jgi:hypothetical protein
MLLLRNAMDSNRSRVSGPSGRLAIHGSQDRDPVAARTSQKEAKSRGRIALSHDKARYCLETPPVPDEGCLSARPRPREVAGTPICTHSTTLSLLVGEVL